MYGAEAKRRGAEKSNCLKRFGALCGTFNLEGKCPSVSRMTALLPNTGLKDWRTISASVKAVRQEVGQML
jgi:hypothetical protein